MDPLTQGLLGAAAAQAVFAKKLPRSAALIGFGTGLLPDADVFIHFPADPVATLVMHRHFTHALTFIPVGGLVGFALLAWLPMFRGRRWAVLGAAMVAYATHALLDACTSYGTLLFWPFSETRISFDFISIIDPIFTLALLVGVVWAWIAKRARPAAIGLALAVTYMGFGAWQHHRAIDAQHRLAAERGHVIDRSRAMPSLFNLVVWRSVYEHDGQLYVDAVRVAPLGPTAVREGGWVEHYPVEDHSTGDPFVDRSMRDYAWFADDYTAVLPGDPTWIADMRYAFITDSVSSIWGLRIRPRDFVEPVAMTGPLDGPPREEALSRLWHDVFHGFAENSPPIATPPATLSSQP